LKIAVEIKAQLLTSLISRGPGQDNTFCCRVFDDIQVEARNSQINEQIAVACSMQGDGIK
jgi:hypothetical protein